jgi:Cupredoxin-like domain
MKSETDEEIEGRNVITVLRKWAVIIVALLMVVVAGAAGLWLMRPTDRRNLAGRLVPTPDFNVAPSPRGDAATRPGDLLITIPLERLENARLKIEAAAAGRQMVVSLPGNPVQMIGGKQVVFVSTDQPGVFAQREVSAGQELNGVVPIYAGLNAGERVVTEGGFLLRAESLKLNPAQLAAPQNRSAAAAQPANEQAEAKPSQPVQSGRDQTQSVTVILNARGYQPESFSLRQGIPARVTFVRKVEGGCGDEIVLADYNIKRELPLDQPVVVEFTPAKTGEFKFACGMDMLRGKIIVQ